MFLVPLPEVPPDAAFGNLHLIRAEVLVWRFRCVSQLFKIVYFAQTLDPVIVRSQPTRWGYRQLVFISHFEIFPLVRAQYRVSFFRRSITVWAFSFDRNVDAPFIALPPITPPPRCPVRACGERHEKSSVLASLVWVRCHVVAGMLECNRGGGLRAV